MALRVLCVGDDKELRAFEPVLRAAAKKYAAARIVTAQRPPDAVGSLNDLGKCDVAFLSNRFTAPGKIEFSDALRKVLKDKHPDTPVVCFGHPSKGGKQGENFHYPLEDSEDVACVGEMLMRAKAGELVADYGGKGRKSTDERRKSMDRDSTGRRPSMDAGSSPKPAPPPPGASPSMRRKSMEAAGGPAMLPPAVSLRRGVDYDALGSPGSANNMNGNFSRMGSMTQPAGTMGSSGQLMMGMGSLSAMPSMPRMSSTRMSPETAMGMGGGMGPMMGSPSMSMNAAATAGLMMPSPSMSAVSTAGLMMGPMAAAPMMHPQPMMQPQPMMTMMQPLQQQQQPLPALAPALTPSPSFPASATSPAGAGLGGVDVNALITSPPAAGSNADLIRMLAEEVVRLRKALEEKKARVSTPGTVTTTAATAVVGVAAQPAAGTPVAIAAAPQGVVMMQQPQLQPQPQQQAPLMGVPMALMTGMAPQMAYNAGMGDAAYGGSMMMGH